MSAPIVYWSVKCSKFSLRFKELGLDHTPGHRSGRIIHVHALAFAKKTEQFSPGRGTKAISLVPGDGSGQGEGAHDCLGLHEGNCSRFRVLRVQNAF